MDIQTIGVVGAGQMGAGIAQVAAEAGIRVVLRDLEDGFVRRGLDVVGRTLARAVEKGKIAAEQRQEVLGRITGTTSLDELAPCDVVVEAIVEEVGAKVEMFAALDRIVKPGAILATNTSSISVTRMGAATRRPDRVIGMHFMNPVPVMKLVEVRDFPGFVSNRVLLPMINEAITCVHEGVATPEAIDTVMKLGMNHPMGPLALADFIGLDTCLAIMEVLHDGLGDDKYRPSPLLRKYVEAGRLGKKSGRGFYEYEAAARPSPAGASR